MKGRSILLALAGKGITIKHDAGKLKFFGDMSGLTAEDKQEIVAAKQDIIDYLTRSQTKERTIEPVGKDTVALSFAQQRLWFIDKLQGGSAEYNIPMVLEVEGKLNIAAATKAFETIFDRHGILRTVYIEKGGETYQHVRPMQDVRFVIEQIDLSHLTCETLDEKVKRLVEQDIGQSFDLASDLMLRVSLLKKTDNQAILLLNMHHIASDGWSMEVLIKEFFTLYQNYSQGGENPLPPLEIQYADYAHWQRDKLTPEALASQLDYWEKQLDEAPNIHSLPLDFPRPENPSHKGDIVSGSLPAEVAGQLQSLAKAHQITPFMLLHGALSLLLSRHSNTNDIVMGTAVANRMQAELEPLIGFFVNTMVLRADTNATALSEYLANIKKVHLEAQSNQDVPFEQLVERLKVPRSTNHTPIFQIMLVTGSDFGVKGQGSSGQMKLPDVEVSSYESDLITTKFDLTIGLNIADSGVNMSWTYDTALFTKAHIEQLNDHLSRLLEGLAQMHVKGQQQLAKLNFMSDTETDFLVTQLNQKQSHYPKDKTIVQVFEQTAERFGNKVAVVCGANQLTYAELNARANQLARYLQDEHAVAPDMLVGLCIERSLEMIVATLAILKAGGAYVPLDPNYPQQRLDYMVEDAGLTLVVAQSHLSDKLEAVQGAIVSLDNEQLFEEKSNENLYTALSPNNLAYVIYTSGSTGKPKGVLIEHIGVIRLVVEQDFMTLDESTIMTQCANIAFDAATVEIWGPLLNGGQSVLFPHRHVTPEAINELVKQHDINTLWLTTGLFHEWSYDVSRHPSLKVVLTGGDVLDIEAVKRTQAQLPHIDLINCYGPTENTAYSTAQLLDNPLRSNVLPIGAKLSTDEAYVLNEQQQLVPFGAVGELYVGGDGLARGYLGRADLTAERFIVNPFFNPDDADSSSRLYRTGDLVRYLPAGNFEFIGRADNQVKIRGFRIELGEVENQLSALDGVDSALVLVKDGQMVGYLKPSNSNDNLVEQSFSALKAKLPAYMVPSFLIVVEQWPLTVNGKIDRNALPQPDSTLIGDYIAPQTQTEKALVAIWAGLLNLDADLMSMTSNFFELGGHSLLSIRLVSEVREKLNAELSVQQVFEQPTLAQMVKLIENADENLSLPAVTPVTRDGQGFPLSFAQQRLWFIDKLQGGSSEYNMPFAMEVTGQLDIPLLERVFTTIIERHEVLRSCYLEHDGEVCQVIRDMADIKFAIEVTDHSDLEGAALEDAVKSLVEQALAQPFDLSRDLMLRVNLIKTSEMNSVLLFNMHHIASDGWSIEVLTKEFFTIYNAYSAEKANPLAPLEVQYGDYAAWQRRFLEGDVLESQMDYWQKQLDDLPAVHSLPLDYPRPEIKQHRGARVYGEVSAATAKTLLNLASSHKLTPFMLLHGALSLLLARHGSSNDIVIGTPVANRTQSAIEPLIGFFVNTLVLRADTNQPTLNDYFEHIRTVHLEAQSNQDVPLEQLVERLKVARTAAHSPLFQIMMTTNSNFGSGESQSIGQLQGLEVKAYESDLVTVKFDLNVDLSISEQGVGLSWTYDTSLFTKAHIEVLNSHMQRLLESLASLELHAAPTDLTILSQRETQHLVCELNDAVLEYDKNQCIHQLIEQQAQLTPDNVAVVFEDKQLTYAELNAKANQLAHYLRANHDIKPDVFVGLCVERSLEMMVGILAVLKAGAAYVPLDPNYPQERLAYLLEDTKTQVVLSMNTLKDVLPSFSGSAVMLDENPQFNEYSSDDLPVQSTGVNAGNLAYVIYTSGSTGKPKGVMIEHRNTVSMLSWAKSFYNTEQLNTVLASTSLNFDISIFELFLPLCVGTRLRVVKNVLDLASSKHVDDITLVNTVPSAMDAIVKMDALPKSVQVVNLAGEALTASLLNNIIEQYEDVVVCNLYGPSEDTTYSTYSKFECRVARAPHIGKVLPNSYGLILDAQQKLVPFGVAGELYLGGDGVSRGYLGREDLTAERYIENPYFDANQPNSAKRIYRTGDLVRYLPDGNIDYIGRVDHQVKIRGFRIELGEVETRLTQVDGVDSSLVTATELAGSMQLLAYVKPSQPLNGAEHDTFVGTITAQLKARLPEYMVPGIIMVIDQWPLTPNGKTDRKALPKPQSSDLQGDFVAPVTQTELSLAQIWGGLLDIDNQAVSATANFFDLGGHSLLSIRLVSEIRNVFGVEVAVQVIFDNPTLSALAKAVENGSEALVRPPVAKTQRNSDYLPLSFAQQRLWFIDTLQGGSSEYNMPVALKLSGELDITLVEKVFNTILARHEVLRTVYVEHNEQTLQHVRSMDDVDFAIEITDLSALSGDEQQAKLQQKVEADINKAFNLAEDLMLRVSYYQTAKAQGVLVFNIHHIASDGWSLQLLVKEFFALFNAYSQGFDNPLPELAVQYGDFAKWQQDHLAGMQLLSQIEYWAQQLDDLPAVHSLPLDYPRPATKQFKGDIVEGILPAQTAKQVLSIAKAHKLTPFMLLHGVLSLLLSRHSNSDDIVVGTPVANRMQSELEPLIGFFVNTLILRADTNHTNLDDYFAHIRQVHLDAQANQDVPFEQLVERLNVPRNTAHTALFQIMMTTNTDFGINSEAQAAEFALPGLEVDSFDSDIVPAKFDLKVDLSISQQGLGLYWTFDVSLFTKAHIEQLNDHLCRMLQALAEGADSVAQLAMFDQTQQQHLLFDLNQTQMDYPDDLCLHQLFEAQAQTKPDDIAIVFEQTELSFAELNAKANQLSHYLVEHHSITPDTLVGICTERSIEMVIAILAVLKAGGAYVPMEPTYPQARLQHMLKDAAIEVVLSQTAVAGVLSQFDGTIVTLDGLADSDKHFCRYYATANLSIEKTGVRPENLAYVIYTSGSTGTPKGVLTEHKALMNFGQGFMAQMDACHNSVENGWLWLSAFIFDASLKGLYLMANGVKLVVPSAKEAKSAAAIAELVKSQKIGIVNATPQLLELIVSEDNLPKVDLISSGEAIGQARFARFKQFTQAAGTAFINAYGPTETTVNSTFAVIDQHTTEVMGRPVGNTQCLVLDKQGNLVPQGATGELYIGGDSLARGYLNLNELTEQTFITNPYYQKDQVGSSAKLYRTGDLVRQLPNGDLVYQGRVDQQVKIRGYRIELEEIEAQLTNIEQVDSAVVLTAQIAGSSQLVAYVKSAELKPEQIQQSLKAKLPEYMVPGFVVMVEQWPMTPSGKLDKRALPQPDGSAMQGEYVAPETMTESKLVAIWADLLNIEPQQISVTANFFALGGHSLLSIRLVAEIRKRLLREVSVQAIFDTGSLRALAKVTEQGAQVDLRSQIKPVVRENQQLPTSFAQQRLWFIDNLQGSSSEYNMPIALEVSGRLDVELLTTVFNTIIERHEVLRTVYIERDGQTLQHIRDMADVDFTINVTDLRHLTQTDREQELKTLVAKDIAQPFNLSADLMLRVGLLKTAEDKGVLMFNMHHIASDGWSMEVLTKEFFSLYGAFSQGQSNPLAPLPVQYGDYASWQREYISGERLESQIDYWRKQLDEVPAGHSLTLDFERPGNKLFAGDTVKGELSANVATKLLALAKTHQLTPFMLLHGALSLVLSRHSNSHDIVVGTPVANRTQAELEPLIGFFVNTLVLRADTRFSDIAEYFGHIRQLHLDAQSNQDIPFEQLVEQLNIPSSKAHTPLFQIMLTTNTNFGLSEQRESFTLPDVDIELFRTDVVTAKFDLNIDLSISEQGVGLNWVYDTSLFEKSHIEQINSHLMRLLEALAGEEEGKPAKQINQLSMLSEQEIAKLTVELNAKQTAYPQDKTIHQLFEAVAAEHPDKVAVSYNDTQLTYGELNQKANQLAHYLNVNHQVQPDSLIGLCVERSVEMVIATIAILKAGGAYVPLDPGYPQERLAYMMNDAGCEVILAHSHLQQKLSGFDGTFVSVDDLKFCRYFAGDNPAMEIQPSNLAYVIYTSGSTGQPKGVLTEHRNVVRLVIDADFMALDASTVMLQCANIAFDAATLELWGPLLNGGQCVLYPEQHVSPELLNKVVEANQVNAMWLTAGLFREWSYSVPTQSSLQYVLAGGDVLDPDAIKRTQAALPELTLINGYGPTENTTFSTTYTFAKPHTMNIVPIGKKLSSDEAYVLDDSRQLVPFGAVGELYVGGDGLARGYLNREDLTEERFINNPFYNADVQNSSAKLYRTGDLVRYLPSGDFEFIGRADSQVKIRGYRIELGEVENQLGRLTGVDSALVLVNNEHLVGYVKADDNAVIDIDALSAELKVKLPDYMVPSFLIAVEQWPLTPNGKVDRRALPEPQSTLSKDDYVAPQSDTQTTLAAIWSELLNLDVERIGADANFFDLGGHSLLTIRLSAQVRERLGVELSVKQIFEKATLSQMAEEVEQNSESQSENTVLPALKPVTRDGNTLPLSFAQQRLWFIDNLQGSSSEYNMPFVMEVAGKLDIALLEKVFGTIIERHEVLRTVYIEQDGQTLQLVRNADEVKFAVTQIDLSDLAGRALDEAVKTEVGKDIAKPFDLTSDLMLRVSLVSTGAEQGVLIFNMHHIASDGWSMEVLAKEFFALFSAYSQDLPNPLEPLAIQYGDYAHWQRAYLEGEVLEGQLDFWQKQLDELPALHSLPLDFERPAVKQHQGARVFGELPQTVAEGLLSVAKANNLTPFMLLHSALSLMLSRHANSHDIVIGTPVANRMQSEIEPLIGFFVNTLVLRVDTKQASLADYFSHVKQVHLDAQSNQDVPFEQLVERLKVTRTKAHSPLFQIMMTTNSDFGVGSQGESTQQLPGVEVKAFESDFIAAKFDLNIDLNISEQGMRLNWTFDTSLFTAEHIETLNQHLCRLLEGMVDAQNTAPLHQLEMLEAKEVKQLVEGMNSKEMVFDKTLCLHQLFERYAELTPDKVAVICKDEQLSFNALNEKANRLAHYLIVNYQLKPDTLVGLCLERSVDMLVAIVAVMKAGGAYVPMDPTYPQERLDYIANDAAFEVVIDQSNIAQLIKGAKYFANTNPDVADLNSNHLAYVIYTSGSTGNPKGVMIEHQSAMALTTQMNTWFDGVETIGWCANYVFDASVQGIVYLMSGHTLVVVPDDIKVAPLELKNYIQSHNVDLIDCTPSLAQFWLDAWQDFEAPNMLVGGEAISAGLWQQLSNLKAKVLNVYGPTECTVNSTVALVEGEKVHIGKTLDFGQAYIFCPSDLSVVPFGTAGELFIGGDGLARGYLNLEKMTEERFIENPFYNSSHPNSSKRIYRTGDLVRYLDDGNIEFIGRTDDQVKIRGFRVELGDVQSQLAQVEGVDSAFVVVNEGQLVGYVKPEQQVDDQARYIKSLLQTVKGRLPEYMVPGFVVLVEQWPLTHNGKIDKKALPQPDGSSLQGDYVAPQSQTEMTLTEIWAGLLGLDAATISTSANFFELGGHSLLSIRLVSEIRKQLATEVSVQSIFDNAVLSELAAVIEQGSDTLARPQIIPVARENNRLPSSFAQQRLWFIDNLQGGSSEYNMPIVMAVSGGLDVALLEKVFTTIIERHEVLRTVYVEHEGHALQHIRDMADVDFAVEVTDLSHLSGESQSRQVQTLIGQNVSKPFDLACDLMLRVSLIKTGANDAVLLFNMHHIASDGWSMQVLTKEFFALYNAYSKGSDNPLPPLNIQYGDYAVWQREYLSGDVLESQLDYWTKQLDEVPSVHGLPLDFDRPQNKRFAGDAVKGVLGGDTAKALLNLAQTHQLTPFMLLHGALSLVLSRHSNSFDVVVGTPVANRLQAELEPLIGFFVNTLVLRVDTNKPSIAEYLKHVRQVNLDAQSNQDIPFEQLVERLNVQRSSSHTPLFQIMLTTNTNFGLTQDTQNDHQLDSIAIEPHRSDIVTAKFDLTVDLSISQQGVGLNWTFDTSLFSKAHVSELNNHLMSLLEGLAAADTQHSPAQLPMISDDERHHLLVEMNDTKVDYADDKCLHELFEQQAALRPDHIAVRFEDSELTYGELNEKANQLAHYLRTQHNVAPDTPVGLCVGRSLEIVIGMVAINKAGGAYVPLDPAYPQDRLSYMMSNGELDVVLTQSEVQHVLGDYQGNVVLLDGLVEGKKHLFKYYSKENLPVSEIGLNPTHLAYVIYTSGSTGRPKGVMVEHDGVVNTIIHNGIQLSINPESVFYQATTIGFDAACWVVWISLKYGATMRLAGGQQYLAELTKYQDVTHLMMTPSMLELVDPAQVSNMQMVAAGGEACSQELVDRWVNNGVDFLNVYGPTEVSIVCSAWSSQDDTALSIGHACANFQFYVLDPAGQPVPKGVIGELYVGGVGVTRGYLNRPDLTEQSFVANPFYDGHNNSSKRLYRTGDLVRYLPDNGLAFVGRVDDQIKLRGFRIELGEIESQINQVETVDSAKVYVMKLGGVDQLVAYVKPLTEVSSEGQSAFIEHVTKTISVSLAEYMVPSYMLMVEQWPLTPNGKVDRKALPQPEVVNPAGEYVAPQNDVEQTLTEIWANLLNLEAKAISTTANFFELGGHSLLSIRLVAEIRKQLSAELSLQQVFEQSTIVQMAQLIEQSDKAGGVAPLKPVTRDSKELPVSFAQQRLWFIDNLQGGSPEYNMPFVLELSGQVNIPLLEKVFSTIVERHEVLRTVYVQDGENTSQLIRTLDESAFALDIVDLSKTSKDDVQALVKQKVSQPFDLANDPMLRVSLIMQSENTAVLVVNMHHIASDGWSMEVLSREFFTLYGAFGEQKANPLPPLEIQYGDYAHWQRTYLEGEVLEAQVQYWLKQLDQLPAVHSLPLDFTRPQVKQFDGEMVVSRMSGETAGKLLGLAKAHKMTPFMLLHGALSLLLARHCGSHDVVIGTPVANRMQAELEPLIGFFVNTLVLRADTHKESLADYFAHIRTVHLEAQSNQDVPFEQLVERLKAPRSKAHSPLFQIMMTTTTDFGVSEQSTNTMDLPGLDIRPLKSGVASAKFDLNIDMSISEQGLSIGWTYDTSLFSKTHIEQLDSHLQRLLEALVQIDCDQSPAKLDILSSNESEYLVNEINDNVLAYDNSLCIHELFEQQCQLTPNKVAVVFEDRQLTYVELNARANQLAHYLKEHHQLKPDSFVGLCVERSLEMMIGILAILKAGGAYVPLDPNYPQERLAYLLEDTATEVVLSMDSVKEALPNFAGQTVLIDDLCQKKHFCRFYSPDNLDAKTTGVTAQNLAYIIYTSGSTGKPKGVMIEHRNTVSMLSWAKTTYSLDELETVLASTSLNFDISIYELFLPLCVGTKLRVVKNVLDLANKTHVEDITLVNTVPSAMDAIVKMDALPGNVKVVNLAGEALRTGLLNGIMAQYQGVTVCNLYGPSEDTTYSTYARFDEPVTRTPHIGKVLANSCGLILDEQQKLVPFGVAGELYLGGDGVSRGYLNRDDLTEERYIDNPFYDPTKANSAKRIYRTGDLVRYLPDGNIDYIGRVDHQVKIRGFRIELGEVETRLSKVEGVDSALVTATEIAGSQQLLAYVNPVMPVAEEAQAEFVKDIQNVLKTRLPEYMVPSIIMVVNQWPLTPNGKIDRKALPEPDGSSLQGEYVAPVTDTEKALAEIWAELLNVNPNTISLTANFFDLGGHSLLSVRLMAAIQSRFDKHCELADLFDNATMQSQGDLLDNMTSGLDNQSLLKVVRHQADAANGIFFIPGAAGTARDFNQIIDKLPGANCDIAIFRHKGLVAGEQYFETFEQNVDAFEQVLNESLNGKNYQKVTLIGHSYGGALSLALVNRLKQAGVNVELVMLDTYFDQSPGKLEGIEQLNLPKHLLSLYEHQFELFCQYPAAMPLRVPTTFIFAAQSNQDADIYAKHLRVLLGSKDIRFAKAQGSHYSMLAGPGAETIAKQISIHQI